MALVHRGPGSRVVRGPPPSPPRVYAPGELHEEYAFSQADLFPEGAAYDAVSQSFFVGSLAHGNVTRLSIDGEESVFVAGRDGQLTLGMSVGRRLRSITLLISAR
jgi:hypothetical protein